VGRQDGYHQALAHHDLSQFQGYVLAGLDVDSWISGNEAMKKLLALAPCPEGVFCYNDPIAIGAIDAVLEAGLRVPDDIAVIGCGNLHFDRENQSTRISYPSGLAHCYCRQWLAPAAYEAQISGRRLWKRGSNE
jgi:DNA-binding LacI/PurR family transcriptional regulator